MNSVLSLLGPILLAFLGFFFVKNISYFGSASRVDRLAKSFETAASWCLPLIVLRMVRKTNIDDSLWLTFALGFLLPVVVFLVFVLARKMLALKPMFSEEPLLKGFLFSSFGGGNRGNLLILIAFGAHSSLGPQVIKHFVVMDLGNLLFLLTVGFWAVRHYLEGKPEGQLFVTSLQRLLKTPTTYLVAAIFLNTPWFNRLGLEPVFGRVDTICDFLIPFLAPFVSFSIFFALFIRTQSLRQVVNDIGQVLPMFVLVRGLAALLLGLILSLMLGLKSMWLGFDMAIAFACSCLLLMPPSSILWLKISSSVPRTVNSSTRDAVYLTPNVFYLLILCIAVVWSLLV
jgi:hypothetical protein